jgi:hypothetical protein
LRLQTKKKFREHPSLLQKEKEKTMRQTKNKSIQVCALTSFPSKKNIMEKLTVSNDLGCVLITGGNGFSMLLQPLPAEKIGLAILKEVVKLQEKKA